MQLQIPYSIEFWIFEFDIKLNINNVQQKIKLFL